VYINPATNIGDANTTTVITTYTITGINKQVNINLIILSLSYEEYQLWFRAGIHELLKSYSSPLFQDRVCLSLKFIIPILKLIIKLFI